MNKLASLYWRTVPHVTRSQWSPGAPFPAHQQNSALRGLHSDIVDQPNLCLISNYVVLVEHISILVGTTDIWISTRVPDDRFEQSLAELRELAVRVTSESTSRAGM